MRDGEWGPALPCEGTKEAGIPRERTGSELAEAGVYFALFWGLHDWKETRMHSRRDNPEHFPGAADILAPELVTSRALC